MTVKTQDINANTGKAPQARYLSLERTIDDRFSCQPSKTVTLADQPAQIWHQEEREEERKKDFVRDLTTMLAVVTPISVASLLLPLWPEMIIPVMALAVIATVFDYRSDIKEIREWYSRIMALKGD
jgi:hypothetical protein